jgi:hypothetical protein
VSSYQSQVTISIIAYIMAYYLAINLPCKGNYGACILYTYGQGSFHEWRIIYPGILTSRYKRAKLPIAGNNGAMAYIMSRNSDMEMSRGCLKLLTYFMPTDSDQSCGPRVANWLSLVQYPAGGQLRVYLIISSNSLKFFF